MKRFSKVVFVILMVVAIVLLISTAVKYYKIGANLIGHFVNAMDSIR